MGPAPSGSGVGIIEAGSVVSVTGGVTSAAATTSVVLAVPDFGRPPSAKLGRINSHQYQTAPASNNITPATIAMRTLGEAISRGPILILMS